jgi:DNA-binding PadR family transcriptional regulator
MRFLSRPEELILLAIWKLEDTAYGVPIREKVSEISGREWSFGAVYVPLSRLEKKGLVRSLLGPPSKIRGGRGKRYYTVTKSGLRSLAEMRELHESLWLGTPKIIIDETSS